MSGQSPRANRLGSPRWLDTRLVLGILLVLLAVVVGARVFASADHYSRVYVARRALVPGEHLTATDLDVTAKVASGSPVPAPTLVIAAVPVDAYQGGSRALSDTAEVAVVLAVPNQRVVDVVHALETGTIDLVRVPAPASAASP